jgi:hypothetical protein
MSIALLSASDLCDEIGKLDGALKAIEAQLKAAKAEFKARGLDSAVGASYEVSKTVAIRQTLDVEAVKADMGQAWFDDHSKLAEIETIRIKAKKPVVIIA